MRKQYENPFLSILSVEETDLLTTSGPVDPENPVLDVDYFGGRDIL